MDIKKRYLELIKEIEENQRLYYLHDKPKISDYKFDEIFEEAIQIEKKHPEIALKNSPTKRVGGFIREGFTKTNHIIKMESLDNAFNKADILAFDKKIKEKIKNPKYILEEKIDGLSVAITYEKGGLILGATRGDGLVGEDITQNLRTIMDIPLKLNKDINITVRGEVFMSRKDFNKLNQIRLKNNESLFSNERNAAAGSLRQLDSSITAKRKLSVFIFEVMASDKNFITHSNKLEYLRSLGFKISNYSHYDNIEDLIEEIKNYKGKRFELEYAIDGLVIKLEEEEGRKLLSSTSKAPRWAIAYKFPPEMVKTKIKSVSWSVGRTGIVTPTANLNKVLVDGSMVKRATLHNIDYIREKDINIGDEVFLQKAGDVIPQIVQVDISSRKDAIFIEEPKICPSCKEELIKEDIAIRCINRKCPEKFLRAAEHFVSRDAFAIMGLGEKVLGFLVENGYIYDVVDIFYIYKRKEELYKEKGFGKKSIDKLILNIEKSKDISLDRVIYALGIEHLGIVSARELVKENDTWEKLISLNIAEIKEIDGFGEILAKSVFDFFRDEKSLEIINGLRKLGIANKSLNKDAKGNILKGKSFVITGKFDKYSRKDIEIIITKNSGNMRTAVSKNTDYLIAGESAGSKLVKAKKIGIKIISIDDFFEILEDKNGL